ncbi:MAG: hypothetical protein ABIG03_05115 [Candidatus Eisenbacteria bacterium]
MRDRRTGGAAPAARDRSAGTESTGPAPGALARTIAVAVPILVVLALLEVLVRLAGIASPNHWMVYDDTVVKGRPNATYVNRKENRNVVRLNDVGFHDRDWSVSDDDYVLLFLGDSMTEGIQVPVDSLFTSVLEDRFAAEGRKVDVLNAAVSATGTGHQYLLWKTFIRDLGVRIDHVVVCLFPQNDLKNNHVSIGKGPENYGVYLDADGRPYVHKLGASVWRGVARKLTDHSALLNLVYTRLRYLRGGAQTEDEGGETAPAGSRGGERSGSDAPTHPDLEAPGSEELWSASLDRTLALIESWNREVAATGSMFSVVIVPNTDRTNPYEDELRLRLEAKAEVGTMRVFTLTLGGRDLVETNSFDGVTLGHLNCEGHRLAAVELHEWLGPVVAGAGDESAGARGVGATETGGGGE